MPRWCGARRDGIAVKHELRGRTRASAQRQHGRAQLRGLRAQVGGRGRRGARARTRFSQRLRVHGGDRLVPQRVDRVRPAAQIRRQRRRRCQRAVAQQLRRLGRRGGQHHAVKAFGARRRVAFAKRQLPLRAFLAQGRDARPQPHLRAARRQPAPRAFREKRAQVHARQQQVGAAARAQHRIAQHAQKHARAGLRHGRVQRRHAQRLDEAVAQRGRQPGAKRAHAELAVALKTRALPGGGRPQQAELVAPAPAACAQNARRCIPRRGPVGQGQAAAVRKGQCQRQAQQSLVRVDAHLAHQPQAFGVCANQDVLAVVHRHAAPVGQRQRHRPRAPAELPRRFQHGDAVPRLLRPHRRRHARPAPADDGNALG